jgi:hypothetical protein
MAQPERLQDAFPRAIVLGVRTVAWACRYLSRLFIPRLLVAIAVIAIAMTVTVYALWVGAMLWFVTGRFGIVKSGPRRRPAELLVALLAIASLLALCANEGRPATNVAFIGVFAVSGAILWFQRQIVLKAFRSELSAALRRAYGAPAERAVCEQRRVRDVLHADTRRGAR